MPMPSQPNSTHRSAFAVIQAPVLYSKQLNDAEKIIYGHISNLCNEYGYCYATNQYLSDLTGKSLAAVKRAIKKLTDLNFIEINHLPKGRQDERQITLSQFPKSIPYPKSNQNTEKEKRGGGSSKMSHLQLKNELPGGSKMSHRIIKEEYSNKNTTTQLNDQPLMQSSQTQKSSSSFKCKTKIQKLEDLPISHSQKQKIYHHFDEKQILKGLTWLENISKRDNPGAALYDALKNDYEPRKSQEEIVNTNQKYAQAKLAQYEEQIIKGYKVSLCRHYVEFSAVSGKSYYFDYSFSNFKHELDSFCAKLGFR
jgi:hypothetical protein